MWFDVARQAYIWLAYVLCSCLSNLFGRGKSSSIPVSWLESHTKSVIAAVLGVWHCYRICKSEPHLLLSHPNSRSKQSVNYFRQKMASDTVKKQEAYSNGHVLDDIVLSNPELDFTQLEVALPKQGRGNETALTCPAALGFRFAGGTTDEAWAFDFKKGDTTVIEKS
nr:neutral ceramidase [Tanacetum cinerariifolium]